MTESQARAARRGCRAVGRPLPEKGSAHSRQRRAARSAAISDLASSSAETAQPGTGAAVSYGASASLSYDAFISYSHAKDKAIATALQGVVQKLGKPWYRRRALRVFRDDTSLSATPHLWPAIERAPEIHLHLYWVSAEDVAAIIARHEDGPA